MKRIFFVLSVISVAGSVMSQRGVAQDPSSILTHYRVAPRLSTLHQNGGIAGIDLLYRLLGKYDFFRGTATNTGPSFENAEIWGAPNLPIALAYVIDVDRRLNLEGLHGEQLPVLAPFDVYKFRGLTADGSSIELFASVIGPWMYVRGGTKPPPGSADYFKYYLRMAARSGPFADFNSDGIVDGADYTLLRKGATGNDELTAGAGFAEWRQQFGETVPDLAAMDAMLSAATASFLTTASVPEPASLVLAICGALLLAGLRRRRS